MKFDTKELPLDSVQVMFNQLRQVCEEEGYICMCSPFNVECVTDSDKVINIDSEWYSLEELRGLIHDTKA